MDRLRTYTNYIHGRLAYPELKSPPRAQPAASAAGLQRAGHSAPHATTCTGSDLMPRQAPQGRPNPLRKVPMHRVGRSDTGGDKKPTCWLRALTSGFVYARFLSTIGTPGLHSAPKLRRETSLASVSSHVICRKATCMTATRPRCSLGDTHECCTAEPAGSGTYASKRRAYSVAA